jgi:hypothetical protein
MSDTTSERAAPMEGLADFLRMQARALSEGREPHNPDKRLDATIETFGRWADEVDAARRTEGKGAEVGDLELPGCTVCGRPVRYGERHVRCAIPEGRTEGKGADLHAICERLNAALDRIGDYAHDHSTGPAVPDALWEVRRMAYESQELIPEVCAAPSLAATAAPATPPQGTRAAAAPTEEGARAQADANLRALLRYTENFYGVAIHHGMKAGYTADAIAHIEKAGKALHQLVHAWADVAASRSAAPAIPAVLEPWKKARFGVFHPDGRFEELPVEGWESHPLAHTARWAGGIQGMQVLRAALRNLRVSAPSKGEEATPACNPHPDAPHGFNRQSSINAHRYVCECEGWEPEHSGSTSEGNGNG